MTNIVLGQKNKESKMPLQIWVLFLVILLMTSSSAIIFNLTPVYMTEVLGLSMKDLGWIEAVVESVALATRIFSGVLSDYFARRKFLVVIGYAVSTVGKLIVPFASTLGAIYTTRIVERLGNGLQAAPRDAWIGDLSPVEVRGAAYGLRQASTKFGSVIGSAIVFLLMSMVTKDYKTIFIYGAIPSIIGLFLLVIFVKDKPLMTAFNPKVSHLNPLKLKNVKRLGRTFWMVMVVVVLYNLAHCSEAFLVMRARSVGIEVQYTPLVQLLMNSMLVILSYHIGKISDRLGRKLFLSLGLVFMVAACFVLAVADSIYGVALGVIFWGIQMAMVGAMMVVIVADSVPSDLRGTAFGMFYLVTGIAVLVSSPFYGYLWDIFGPKTAFLAASSVTLFTLAYYMIVKIPDSKKVS